MQLTEFYMRNESMLVFQNESPKYFCLPEQFQGENFYLQCVIVWMLYATISVSNLTCTKNIMVLIFLSLV